MKPPVTNAEALDDAHAIPTCVTFTSEAATAIEFKLYAKFVEFTVLSIVKVGCARIGCGKYIIPVPSSLLYVLIVTNSPQALVFRNL